MATTEKVEADVEAVQPEPKKKGLMKYLLIGVGALVLVGLSVGVSMYMATNILADKGNPDEVNKKESEAKKKKTESFFSFEQPIVVNFKGENSMRFLQVTIDVMTYEPEIIPEIQKNMPVIRNNLIFMLSGLTVNELGTQEGKAKLRADALAEIQKIMKERSGKPAVEDLYFTSFVMQ